MILKIIADIILIYFLSIKLNMNNNDLEILKNLKVYCPPGIITKYSHKHKLPEEWVRFYYYKDKVKTAVKPENLGYDYEVSSTLNYRKDVFYKMTTMSQTDEYFDYYFKLKPDLPQTIVKQCNKKENGNPRKHTLKKRGKLIYDWKNPPKKPHEMDEDGKFIIHFN